MLQSTALQIKRQQGFVVVMLLLILTLGISTYLLREVRFPGFDREREEETTRALAEAKKAIMSRMIVEANGSTPDEIGTLSCPDEDNNGDSEGCAGVIATGRIPYRTLDIPEIRDGYGEGIWYFVPNIFDANPAITDNVNYENLHDINHQLTLDGQPVSVIIASPGDTLAGQDRSSATENDIENYLDDVNNDGDADFVTTSVNPLNDRLITITPDEIEEYLDNYLINSIRNTLETFAANNGGLYPYPEDFGDTNCDVTSSNFLHLEGYYIGKLPTTFTISSPPDSLVDCPYDGSVEFNQLSDSIKDVENNNDDAKWANFIWYAVSPDCVADPAIPANDCDSITGGDFLTLDGVLNRQKYLIVLGKRPLNIVINECPDITNAGSGPDAITVVPPDQTNGDPNNLCRYIENVENLNEDLDFVTPHLPSNDIIFNEPLI